MELMAHIRHFRAQQDMVSILEHILEIVLKHPVLAELASFGDLHGQMGNIIFVQFLVQRLGRKLGDRPFSFDHFYIFRK